MKPAVDAVDPEKDAFDDNMARSGLRCAAPNAGAPAFFFVIASEAKQSKDASTDWIASSLRCSQ
jgi:hypothetical protein